MKYKRRSQFVSTVFSYIYIIVVFNVSFNVNKYPIINNINNINNMLLLVQNH